MRFDTYDTIAIYTGNDEGTFDELIVDMTNKDYDFTGNIDERELWKIGNNKAKEFLVDRNFFDAFFEKVKQIFYSGSEYTEEKPYKVRQEERRLEDLKEKQRPVITKDKIWQGIRWELDEEELNKIISYDFRYENDDYYDFDLILDKVHAVMNDEKSINYFTSWCILLMRCFMDNMNYKRKKLLDKFYELGYFFDGLAFMDSTLKGEEKLKDCRETIAYLKHCNHEIENIKNKTYKPFMTNNVITYVSFSAYVIENNNELSRVCVVDEEKKTVNYLYVSDIDYCEDINYTFLSMVEFDGLMNKYYEGYALDTSMSANFAKLVKR